MKNKLIMIVGLIGILLPLNIKALSGSVNLSCNSNTITVGSSTTCTLSGNSNEGVSAISAKLSASGNISVSNISTSSIWQGNGEGGSIDLYTDTNKSGNFAIATFTIRASSAVGTGKINVNNIKFYDASFNEHSISGKSLTITVKAAEKPKQEDTIQKPTVQQSKPSEQKPEIKSSDSSLKTLILSNGVINFSGDVLDYNVEVENDIESITIIAEANDNKAQVLIPENLNLNLGINDFEVKVVAEDGTETIYKLHINRLEKVLVTNSKTDISFIVMLILFLISLGLNVFFIFKINNNKNKRVNQPNTNNNVQPKTIVNSAMQSQQNQDKLSSNDDSQRQPFVNSVAQTIINQNQPNTNNNTQLQPFVNRVTQTPPNQNQSTSSNIEYNTTK